MAVKKKASKSPKKLETAKPSTKKVVSKAPAKKSAPKKLATPKKVVAPKAAAKPAKKVAAKKSPAPKPAKQVPVKALKPEPKKAAPVAKPKPVPLKAPAAKTPAKSPAPKKPAVQSPPRNSMVGPVEIAPYQPGVSEEYMSNEQLGHFRLILNQWKEQLMQEVDSTVGHMKEEAILYPDPLDRAAQEEGFNLELRTRDRERRLIKKIEMSLDKIDNGEYGFCKSCGTEIGLRRLEARPTADKCIDCKTFEEIREKQSGL
jgi:DnaK suppressor protein